MGSVSLAPFFQCHQPSEDYHENDQKRTELSQFNLEPYLHLLNRVGYYTCTFLEDFIFPNRIMQNVLMVMIVMNVLTIVNKHSDINGEK